MHMNEGTLNDVTTCEFTFKHQLCIVSPVAIKMKFNFIDTMNEKLEK